VRNAIDEQQRREKNEAIDLALNNLAPEIAGDKDRQMFVIKVYTLCVIQILITTLLTIAAVKSEHFRDFIKEN